MIKKELAKKIILIGLILSLALLTACSVGGRNQACSDTGNCNFYTGSRGIITYLDRPPTHLYYRAADAPSPDGNAVQFNVRVLNDGASASYGAVFFSGVSSESFRLSRIDQHGERPVLVPKTQQACYLDFFNIGEFDQLGTWNFMANCFGAGISQYGDRTNLNLNFQQLSQYIPYLEPLANAGLDLDLTWVAGEMTQFSIGSTYALLNYGRSLMVIISALNFEAFGGASFILEGDNQAYPGGETDYKSFKLKMNGPWPAGQDYFTIPYNIKTCYAYTTFVSPMICVDPDPFSDEYKNCRDYSSSIKGSQGAPIAVTNIRTTNTGSETIIDMTIRNIGIGTVWDVGYLEHCSPYFPGTVRPTMKDVVYVGYAHIDNKPLNCGTTFRLRLDPRTKEARLTCRYDLMNTDYVGSAYETPLRMELWYGYEENLRNQITIRRVG